MCPMFGFLGEKENSLKTDDYGRDLSSVQTLLTKQVSCGKGRSAFFFETLDDFTVGPRDSVVNKGHSFGPRSF